MKAKVLVVDDSRTVRRLVGSSLARGGYEMLEAGSGEEGLAMIQQVEGIAMVLCDVNMPNMSGIQMVEQARAGGRGSSLPIVMLSTEGRVDVIAQARRAGARGWMVKPFKSAQLLDVVNRLVGVAAGAPTEASLTATAALTQEGTG